MCNIEVRVVLYEVQVDVHELILGDYKLMRYDKLQDIFLKLGLLQVLKF